MRFIFINPNRAIVRSNIWSVINSITPPLGLATLSAVVERDGHETEIIDAMALNYGIDDILSKLKSLNVQEDCVIGITVTTPEIEFAANIARAIRNHFPAVKILMGGVHSTIFHDELIKQGICDMVIRGEGENAILEIARGTRFEDIPNLTWGSPGNEVFVNDMNSDFVDLEGLPYPSYHKLPMDKYHSALGAARHSPSIGMITSRGCPGKCTFCFSGMFGSRIRFTAARKVFEHIEYLKSTYGIREISFYDDTFTTSKKRVEELCHLMITEKINLSWSCFARVDSVSLDLLKLMKEAGCHQIMYGFESVDENILKTINKKVTSSKYHDIISWTKEAAIDIRGAFMLGSPGETEESMRKTIDYSKKIGIKFAIYNITTPFPGTALFEWAKKECCLKHTQWPLYDLAHAILEIPTVQSSVVEDYYKKAYREFYLRPHFILNHLLSISTIDEVKTYWKVLKGLSSMLLPKKIT